MKNLNRKLITGLNILRRLFESPDFKRVRWLNFAITYLCNGRCITCSIWKKYKENPQLLRQELTLREIKRCFSESKYLENLQGIGLTGGEPFLRKDFVDLVGFFIQKYPKASISVATNGLVPNLIRLKTKEIIDRFTPASFGLSISLDGIGEVHNMVRGINDAYDNVIKTVETLQKEVTVDINLSFTITPQNYNDLPKVYELSKKYKIGFIARFAQNSRAYYGNKDIIFEWTNDKLKEVEFILNEINNDRIKDQSFMAKILEPYTYFLSNCIKYEKIHKRMFQCYSGIHSFYLDPYGNVYPCVMLDKKIGNIKDESFDDLWCSLQAKEIREYIKSNQCHCWTECETIPSLARDLGVIKWNIQNKILKRVKWKKSL